MSLTKSLTIFAAGGLAYGLIELAWRGRTHISMFVAGGICFLLIDLVGRKLERLGILTQAMVSSAMITAVEFTTGVIVNIWLDLNVWDYSAMRADLLGQICPLFSFLWIWLSIPAMFLASGMRKVLFGEMPAKMQLLPRFDARKAQV